MKAVILVSAAWFLFPGLVLATDPAHALRQTRGDVVFHYGLVPAQVVLAHPDKHPEREMHVGVVPKGASHLVVALLDATNGERIATAEVTATVALLGGASVTRRLQAMTIADQPSFGGFFGLGVPACARCWRSWARPSSSSAR